MTRPSSLQGTLLAAVILLAALTGGSAVKQLKVWQPILPPCCRNMLVIVSSDIPRGALEIFLSMIADNVL